MSPGRIATWIVVSMVLALSSPARAASSSRLTYDAPKGCPSERDFLDAVADRGGELAPSPAPDEATRTGEVVVVSIRKQSAGFTGELHVQDGRTTTDRRQVRGATCAEIVDALAVVTAIALRAEATGQSPPPGVNTAAAEPGAPRSAASREGAPATAAPASFGAPDDRLLGHTRVFPPRTETLEVPAGPVRFDLHRSLTAYAGAAIGIVPSLVLPRFELSQVIANFVTTPDDAHRISGLILKIRLGVMGPGTRDAPGGKTDVSGLSVGVDFCQSPHYDTKGLVLLFCGGLGGGIVMLKTSAPSNADGSWSQSKSAGFGEGSLSTELQYYLGAGFHLGVKASGALALGEVSAEGRDGTRLFKSSPWSASALLGVGFRF